MFDKEVFGEVFIYW